MSNIHWDDFTNPQDARKLEQFKTQQALKKAPYTSEQLAIILGGTNPTSLRELTGLVGGPFDIADPRNGGAKTFKVKYIQQGTSRQAASACLPDYTSITKTSNVQDSFNKTPLQTYCIARADLANDLQEGDVIVVKTLPSDLDEDIPSLQFCEMLRKAEIGFLNANAEEDIKAVQETYGLIFDGATQTLANFPTGDIEKDNSPHTNYPVNITWAQATAISQTSAYKKLGRWVKGGEGTYESVIGQRTGFRDTTYNPPKKITQMTFNEIKIAQAPGGSVANLNRTSVAVGAYQWVQSTFIEAVEYFKATSPNEDLDNKIFNAQAQEALSTFLFLAKADRLILGNYLLGLHNNAQKAGQYMAFEWASIPVQYGQISPHPKCNKMVYRGQSAYEGCFGNRSHSGKGHGPENVIEVLKEAQSQFISIQATQQLISSDPTLASAAEAAAAARVASNSQIETEATEEEELAAVVEANQ